MKAGIPRNSVVPVKNYATEYEPDVVAGILLLRGVYEALNSATDYLREASERGDFDQSGEFKKLKVTPISLPPGKWWCTRTTGAPTLPKPPKSS